MQGLNLKECRKIEEDEKSATFHHPKGHQIKIAKSVLSPKMRESLEKLPLHKAEGGDVYKENKYPEKASEKEHEEYLQKASKNREENHKKFMESHEEMMEPKKMAEGGDPQEDHPPEQSNAPDPNHGVNININAAPQPQATPAPAAQPPAPQVQAAPASPPPPLAAATQAPAPEQSQDDFQTTDFKAPENIDKSLNASSPMQSMQQRFADAKAQNNQELMKENDAFEQDLVNGHIQPKTYSDLFHEKGTLGKIGTLFGLLVGGAGSGLAHQDNALLKMMDNQIRNDLEGQIKSKENAQNFLRLNQADLTNKTAAMNTEESAKTQALARTQAQMYQASYHHLLTIANGLPPAQQAKFKQALMVLYPELKGKINNINDLASSAMATQGMNPFNQNQPQGGGSVKNVQKPGAPMAKNQPQKAASAEDEHLLSSGANDAVTNAITYNPRFMGQKDSIASQKANAALADKAIDTINQYFGKVNSEVTKSGYFRRNSDVAEGSTGVISGIGKGISALIHGATESPENRAYSTDYDQLVGAVRGALKGNVSEALLDKMVKDSAPEAATYKNVWEAPQEDKDLLEKKRTNMINFIKSHIPTDQLENIPGVMNKHRKK